MVTNMIIAITSILIFSIGCMLMFNKSGIHYIQGFIPIWNVYQLGNVCGSKKEAVIAMIGIIFTSNRMSILIRDFYYVVQYHTPMQISYCVMCFILLTVTLYYTYTLFSNLCEVYHASNLFIILMFIALPLVILYFGISKKYYPHLQPDEMNDEEY